MELTINNITKQYGNVTVLDDVSYRFTPGIYGILGANGAGKTTLFRIICGLMRANCGNIQYDRILSLDSWILTTRFSILS